MITRERFGPFDKHFRALAMAADGVGQAVRLADRRDQKGVVMRSPIRIAQPCSSLTTSKVIMAHVPAMARKKRQIRTPEEQITIHKASRGMPALIHVNWGGQGAQAAPRSRGRA